MYKTVNLKQRGAIENKNIHKVTAKQALNKTLKAAEKLLLHTITVFAVVIKTICRNSYKNIFKFSGGN